MNLFAYLLFSETVTLPLTILVGHVFEYMCTYHVCANAHLRLSTAAPVCMETH